RIEWDAPSSALPSSEWRRKTRKQKERNYSMKTMITSHDSLLTILRLRVVFILIAIACIHSVHAVNPPPEGGYAGNNTAEGTSALFSLTTGVDNTGLGF